MKYLEDVTGLPDYPDEALYVWAENGKWEGRLGETCLSPAPYIVMELVKGKSVRELIKQDTLTLRDCGAILHQAAYAIQQLHDMHVIHRDFRVHNLMWSGEKLKVLDFGLAMMKVSPDAMRSKNPLVRTFWSADSYWMPPEVKNSKVYNFCNEAAHSFDMYSYGVLVEELLLDPGPRKRMTKNKMGIEEQEKVRLDPLHAVE